MLRFNRNLIKSLSRAIYGAVIRQLARVYYSSRVLLVLKAACEFKVCNSLTVISPVSAPLYLISFIFA